MWINEILRTVWNQCSIHRGQAKKFVRGEGIPGIEIFMRVYDVKEMLTLQQLNESYKTVWN